MLTTEGMLEVSRHYGDTRKPGAGQNMAASQLSPVAVIWFRHMRSEKNLSTPKTLFLVLPTSCTARTAQA